MIRAAATYMKRRSYDVTSRSIESTILRLWRHPYKRNGKTGGNSFAYCLVDDVKHNENDVERHEVNYVYWRQKNEIYFSNILTQVLDVIRN